jgi:hypothetical protein
MKSQAVIFDVECNNHKGFGVDSFKSVRCKAIRQTKLLVLNITRVLPPKTAYLYFKNIFLEILDIWAYSN